ncbi:MAG: type II toxin-antitoxin system RelE/ParE family toxin [Deferribacteraceae bacterium]|jgi:plasmid stabilization system protein ParE|nr:type II toxin-antitoxin system RelE/ParE family toxin [Deferribacteraceae bacterium]
MAEKYRVVFTPEAFDDIDLIYDDIAQLTFYMGDASILKQRIQKKIEMLKEFPLSCPLLNHPALADNELRKLVITKQFLAIYFVDQVDRVVYITGVYNSARDYIQFLIGE